MISSAILLASILATNSAVAGETVSATNVATEASASVLITADSTYYDRKEGLAVFKGHVHVDDTDYQLHAARAFVFMNVASNALNRIAAMGHVALTNGTKRAYGEKVTYHRDAGLVVLHGSEAEPARVVDETQDGARTVTGRKIRFWINREQVEVLDAVLSGPRPEGGVGVKFF